MRPHSLHLSIATVSTSFLFCVGHQLMVKLTECARGTITTNEDPLPTLLSFDDFLRELQMRFPAHLPPPLLPSINSDTPCLGNFECSAINFLAFCPHQCGHFKDGDCVPPIEVSFRKSPSIPRPPPCSFSLNVLCFHLAKAR